MKGKRKLNFDGWVDWCFWHFMEDDSREFVRWWSAFIALGFEESFNQFMKKPRQSRRA